MKTLLLIAVLFFLPACGLRFASDVTQLREVTLNGIKLIAIDITDGSSTTAYGQSEYELDANRRLLLRFEEMSEHSSSIATATNKTVQVHVYCQTPDDCLARATGIVSLCPVKRDWMMLATWTFAHPFGAEGLWTTPGADHDAGECIAAETTPPAQPMDPEPLRFDVKDWVVDYLYGRKQNYGWLLKAETTFKIKGEGSGAYSPRLVFEEYL